MYTRILYVLNYIIKINNNVINYKSYKFRHYYYYLLLLIISYVKLGLK
jgi:hypothetical protein